MFSGLEQNKSWKKLKYQFAKFPNRSQCTRKNGLIWKCNSYTWLSNRVLVYMCRLSVDLYVDFIIPHSINSILFPLCSLLLPLHVLRTFLPNAPFYVYNLKCSLHETVRYISNAIQLPKKHVIVFSVMIRFASICWVYTKSSRCITLLRDRSTAFFDRRPLGMYRNEINFRIAHYIVELIWNLYCAWLQLHKLND